MNKALKTMETELKICDVVIYVLDARAPFSCVNPEFTKLIKSKPIIYVLNKCDLANEIETNKWLRYFQKGENVAITLNSMATNSAKILISEIEKLAEKKMQKFANKGIIATVRAMVIGVPNCGKSTLINNLCGKYKASTGNRPGVTRGKQWVSVTKTVEVLDMPGTLWPSFESNSVAHNLAYIGSIKDEVLDRTELAYDFINDIVKIDKSALETRYKIEIEKNDETLQIMEKICSTRGFILRGGEFDYERCAGALIDDFRKGRMGQITLDVI